MLRLPLRFLVLLASLLSGILSASAKERAPDWLAAVAARPVAAPTKDADAVVLLDDGHLDVGRDGVFTRRTRWVVRVLTREGRDYAAGRVPYEADSDKVRSFKAWLIKPSREVVAYGKKQISDVAIYSNALELYAESRAQVIDASEEAGPGAVFAYESVVEERSIFTQEVWWFQSTLPVERSSFSIALPPGWQAHARVFNHAGLEPVTQGNTQTWSLGPLPPTADEPLAPSLRARSPWLALDLSPPPGSSSGGRRAFTTWLDLGTYLTPRYDAAATCDAAMKARADALVAGLASPWERIRALCRYVQQVNYISITLDSGNAGGMTPRSAARVFACNYGDCKDKATLLRALLASQGIASHPVLVYSGDATHVREEWPSPYQFNHAILAIAVDDSVATPAVVTYPTLGRLLFFDPTSTLTPPGLLAESDLGGRGLVLASERTELVSLPAMRVEQNRVERRITARLGAMGEVSGTIVEHFTGHASTEVRDEHRERSATDYQKLITRWLAASLPTPQATRVVPTDAFDEARFDLEIDFASPAHGKLMRNVLLVFKPVLLMRRNSTAFRKESRTQPIVFEPYAFTERTEIELPSGYRIDEKIAPVSLEAPFGTYHAEATETDGKLIFERRLTCRAATIPPEEYETVRTFFEKILQTEQSPVVLERL